MLLVAFLGPAVYDRIRFKRFNRVTLWGGILLFAWGNIRAVLIRPTEGWHQFRRWMAS